MYRLRGKRFRWLLQIGGVELAQISRHTLIDLRKSPLHLRAGEILIAIIDRLELAAVDRNARLREQAQLSTWSRCPTSRPWATSWRATRQVPGSASARPRIR